MNEKIHPVESFADIAKEINTMADNDQKKRLRGMNSQAVDEKNTLRMKHIIRSMGWPTIGKVGEQASYNAWLLVQHADHDRVFQKECLGLMRHSVDDIAQENIAYLTDRILQAEGKPQLYGTQFVQSAESDPKWQPYTIEDAANVDIRRKEIGLQPLKDYAESINTLYAKIGKSPEPDNN
jgi:hypothetical protein